VGLVDRFFVFTVVAEAQVLFFWRKKADIVVTHSDEDVVSKTRNWYHDYYAGVVVQRNILLLVNITMVVLVLVAIFAVRYIVAKRTVEPFVVQVESQTGISSIVDPLTATVANGNEALDNYFLVQYIRARETYSEAEYDYNYKTIVRLLSSGKVYNSFRRYIADPAASPITRYGSNITTSLTIRSIQLLKPGEQAQVRFRIAEDGAAGKVYNKIATIDYGFRPMTLNPEERYVNPLGFQVTYYRVDDEVL
jgi:type IV secretion system protein VirB8